MEKGLSLRTLVFSNHLQLGSIYRNADELFHSVKHLKDRFMNVSSEGSLQSHDRSEVIQNTPVNIDERMLGIQVHTVDLEGYPIEIMSEITAVFSAAGIPVTNIYFENNGLFVQILNGREPLLWQA